MVINIVKNTESAHWYDADGNPCHFQHYADPKRQGELRPTTKADARKLGLFTSVTTIQKILANHAIEAKAKTNIILSALTHPNPAKLGLDEFAKLIVEDAGEGWKASREKGSICHAAISLLLTDQRDKAIALWPDVIAFEKWWLSNLSSSEWNPIVDHRLVPKICGYGGTVDAIGSDKIYDFKTTEIKKYDEVAFWPEYVEQLAAYRHALGLMNKEWANYDLVSVVIPVDAPDRIAMKVWSDQEAADGLEVFQAALKIWKIRNKFK